MTSAAKMNAGQLGHDRLDRSRRIVPDGVQLPPPEPGPTRHRCKDERFPVFFDNSTRNLRAEEAQPFYGRQIRQIICFRRDAVDSPFINTGESTLNTSLRPLLFPPLCLKRQSMSFE